MHYSSQHSPPILLTPSWLCYRTERNFDGGNISEFGGSPLIRQTKAIQISTYN